MKEINGYVIVAKTDLVELLFGKPEKFNHQGYENFETNGLVPFEEMRRVKDVANISIFPQEVNIISIGQIYLKIAESEEELEFFRKKTNLIVIRKEYDSISKEDKLFGPLNGRSRSIPSSLPGARLADNGYTPYRREKGIDRTPFQRAIYQLSEMNRQANWPATIAQFKLKRLEEVFKR